MKTFRRQLRPSWVVLAPGLGVEHWCSRQVIRLMGSNLAALSSVILQRAYSLWTPALRHWAQQPRDSNDFVDWPPTFETEFTASSPPHVSITARLCLSSRCWWTPPPKPGPRKGPIRSVTVRFDAWRTTPDPKVNIIGAQHWR